MDVICCYIRKLCITFLPCTNSCITYPFSCPSYLVTVIWNSVSVSSNSSEVICHKLENISLIGNGNILLSSKPSFSLQRLGLFPVLASVSRCLCGLPRSLFPFGLYLYACLDILPGLILWRCSDHWILLYNIISSFLSYLFIPHVIHYYTSLDQP
jgi:hypothetical protein